MKNPLIITVLSLTLLCSQAYAETRLYISTGFTSPVSDFFNSILTEADKRIPDISIQFEVLPAERALILANQAINDGECCRIPAVVSKQYKNLLPVDKSFFSARFNVFSKKQTPSIKRFDDLKPFSVGVVKGWKITVIKVKEVNPKELHIVSTPTQMFHMLNHDRLDYGVLGYLSGLKSIEKLRYSDIKAIQPPLIEKPLYLMLHKKHKNLIPVFNEVFQSMEDDGTIDRIYTELLKTI